VIIKEYACSHCRHWPHFDLFAREALHKSHCEVETPPDGTVFEHFFEFSEMRDTTNFINYSRRKSPQLFFTSVPQVCLLSYRVHISIKISSFSRWLNCICTSCPWYSMKYMHIYWTCFWMLNSQHFLWESLALAKQCCASL